MSEHDFDPYVSLRIDFYYPIEKDILEYIFDCWTEFVTQDLGLNMDEASMHEI